MPAAAAASMAFFINDGNDSLSRASPTVAAHADVDAFVLQSGNVLEAFDGRGIGSAPTGIKGLAREDAHVPVHAGNADAVVADGANRAGRMRAVAMVVHGVAVAVVRVDPVYVVDVAVGVVVDAVRRRFRRGSATCFARDRDGCS